MVATGSGSAAICLSLHEEDKIRVMNLPRELVDPLHLVIQSRWRKGIQSEGLFAISYEFRLHGKPWSLSSSENEEDEETIDNARGLVAHILCFLLQNGWALVATTNIGQYMTSSGFREKETMYFKHRQGGSDIRGMPMEPKIMVVAMAVVSFHKADRIRVVDGTEELVRVVRSCVESYWHRGLQGEKVVKGVPEFKMYGKPWEPSGTEAMHTRMFVAQFIGALDGAGWQLYTSLDVSTGNGKLKAGGCRASSDRSIDSWVLRTKPSS